MRPKLSSKNYEGMELIRPLYEVKEESIIAWQKYHQLEFIACACPLQENYDKENQSKRKEVKQIIKDLKKYNKNDCFQYSNYTFYTKISIKSTVTEKYMIMSKILSTYKDNYI